MALNNGDPTTFNTTVLVGDTGPGGSPPVLTEISGIPIAAALEVQSTLGAFVLPRMSDPLMQALFPVVDGMIVYNTTNNSVYFHMNGAWVPESSGGGGSVTSISQGANIVLSANPIVATGSVSLNPVLTGLTSAAIGAINIATNIISSANANFNITATASVSNINLTSGSDIFLNAGTAGAGNVGVTNGGRFLLYNNATSQFIALRAPATLGASASYILPATLPSVDGQALISTALGTMSWASVGTGTVSSITAGSNLSASPNPIVSTGTISLSNTVSGLTSVGVGNMTLSGDTISDSAGNLTLTSPLIQLNTSSTVNSAGDFVALAAHGIQFNSTNNGNSVKLSAPTTLSLSTAYLLPAAYPTVNGQILSSTTAGVMTWASPSGTVTSITATGPNLTGGTITTSGSVGLNTTLAGLVSVAVGNITLTSGNITGSSSITMQSSGTGAFFLDFTTVAFTTGSNFLFQGGDVNVVGNVLIETNNQLQLQDSGSNLITFKTPVTLAASTGYTLPPALPTVSGQVLSSTTAGVMTWVTGGGGGGVTSITQGANIVCTPNPIVSTGTVALSTSLVGVVSAAIGNIVISGDQISDNIGSAITITGPLIQLNTSSTVTSTGDYVALSAHGIQFSNTSNTNSIKLSASPTLASTTTYILPIAYPSVTGYVLSSDTSGNMSWSANSGVNANATFILKTADGTMPNAQVLSTLATGIVKNTTATGVLSIAVAGTDYYGPGPTYALSINNAGSPSNANTFIANTSNAPTTPSGGGILYVESGQLKYIGSSGTITTIAPA